MSLSSYPKQDFRFNTKGVYHNNPTTQGGFGKKKAPSQSPNNKICPSCGLVRSRSNKCECNS